MKRLLWLVFSYIPVVAASPISDAWHAIFDGCSEIQDTVNVDFGNLKNVTNDWYTPYSTHSLWEENFCGTTSYIHPDTDLADGVEHQYYLKKNAVKELRSEPKSEWKKIVNHYVIDYMQPGISYWEADIDLILGLKFTSPKTKSYAVVIERSPTPKWWAAYYCSKSDGGMFTEGFDIRSAHLPLEPEIVASIIATARQKGVPEHLLKKLYKAPYKGCIVNDATMTPYIYSGH